MVEGHIIVLACSKKLCSKQKGMYCTFICIFKEYSRDLVLLVHKVGELTVEAEIYFFFTTLSTNQNRRMTQFCIYISAP